MPIDSFGKLVATVNAIQCQIVILKRFDVPLAVSLLEMAKLELLLKMHEISESEFKSFCNTIREAMDDRKFE